VKLQESVPGSILERRFHVKLESEIQPRGQQEYSVLPCCNKFKKIPIFPVVLTSLEFSYKYVITGLAIAQESKGWLLNAEPCV
jgi:hypothetical protein